MDKPEQYFAEGFIVMRPKFQKRSALKLAGRIIPHAKLSGTIAFLVVHTRDFYFFSKGRTKGNLVLIQAGA
jgi:hypothetical protein